MGQPPLSKYMDVMEDMDEDLLDLLKNRLDSFIKWDLIKFFHYHANSVHQIEDLAEQMRRDPKDLEAEANELIAAGIVDRRWLGGQSAFALTEDPATRQLVEKFMQACEDRYFRMKVVYHILRGMG
jgi:hypothetical protein